jgi:hypothetical protein
MQRDLRNRSPSQMLTSIEDRGGLRELRILALNHASPRVYSYNKANRGNIG